MKRLLFALASILILPAMLLADPADTLHIGNLVDVMVPHAVFGVSLVTVLGILFALEQWLASSQKIAANSTFQLIAGIFRGLKIGVTKPPDPPAAKP